MLLKHFIVFSFNNSPRSAYKIARCVVGLREDQHAPFNTNQGAICTVTPATFYSPIAANLIASENRKRFSPPIDADTLGDFFRRSRRCGSIQNSCDMPDIGDFIRRSRRSAKIAIAAPGTPGDRRTKSPSVSLALRNQSTPSPDEDQQYSGRNVAIHVYVTQS